MFITPSFKKSLIVEQFQGNYLKVVCLICFRQSVCFRLGFIFILFVINFSFSFNRSQKYSYIFISFVLKGLSVLCGIIRITTAHLRRKVLFFFWSCPKTFDALQIYFPVSLKEELEIWSLPSFVDSIFFSEWFINFAPGHHRPWISTGRAVKYSSLVLSNCLISWWYSNLWRWNGLARFPL